MKDRRRRWGDSIARTQGRVEGRRAVSCGSCCMTAALSLVGVDIEDEDGDVERRRLPRRRALHFFEPLSERWRTGGDRRESAGLRLHPPWWFTHSNPLAELRRPTLQAAHAHRSKPGPLAPAVTLAFTALLHCEPATSLGRRAQRTLQVPGSKMGIRAPTSSSLPELSSGLHFREQRSQPLPAPTSASLLSAAVSALMDGGYPGVGYSAYPQRQKCATSERTCPTQR